MPKRGSKSDDGCRDFEERNIAEATENHEGSNAVSTLLADLTEGRRPFCVTSMAHLIDTVRRYEIEYKVVAFELNRGNGHCSQMAIAVLKREEASVKQRRVSDLPPHTSLFLFSGTIGMVVASVHLFDHDSLESFRVPDADLYKPGKEGRDGWVLADYLFRVVIFTLMIRVLEVTPDAAASVNDRIRVFFTRMNTAAKRTVRHLYHCFRFRFRFLFRFRLSQAFT